MRAVVFDNNEVSFRADYPDPVPGEGECLVRIVKAGICSTDLQIVRGYMGFRGVLGHEMVGVVEQGPPQWQGKRVAAEINCVCRKCDMCQSGLSNHCRNRTVFGIDGRDGFFADFAAVPVANLHEVPDSISDDDAVLTEPLAAAFQVLTHVRIEKKSRVAVVGPGKLGLLVCQVLQATGCDLLAVGRSEASLAICDKLGIRAQPATATARNADRDVVVECSGHPSGLELAQGLVRPRGTIILKSTYAGSDAPPLWPIVVNEITVIGSRCGPFDQAIQALARGAIRTEHLIATSIPLDRAVDGLRRASDSGAMKVLLDVGSR